MKYVHRCIAEAATATRILAKQTRMKGMKINSVKSAYFQFMYSLCHNDSLYANDSMRQLFDIGCIVVLFFIQAYYQCQREKKKERACNITYLSLWSLSNNAKASQVPYNLCLFICLVMLFRVLFVCMCLVFFAFIAIKYPFVMLSTPVKKT